MRQLTDGEREICVNIAYHMEPAYLMDKFNHLHGDKWVIVDFRAPLEGEWAIGATSPLPPFFWDRGCTAEPRFIIRKRLRSRWNPLRWK